MGAVVTFLVPGGFLVVAAVIAQFGTVKGQCAFPKRRLDGWGHQIISAKAERCRGS